VKIIVGLGNPGTQYRMSRHNIGFQVVDRIAQINHISVRTKRFKSLYGTGRINFQQVVLSKPMTFMNRSGEAVKKATDFFTASGGGEGFFLKLNHRLFKPFQKHDPQRFCGLRKDLVQKGLLDSVKNLQHIVG